MTRFWERKRKGGSPKGGLLVGSDDRSRANSRSSGAGRVSQRLYVSAEDRGLSFSARGRREEAEAKVGLSGCSFPRGYNA